MPDCLQSFLFRAAQHESELSLGQSTSWHVTMVAGMPGEFRDTKHILNAFSYSGPVKKRPRAVL